MENVYARAAPTAAPSQRRDVKAGRWRIVLDASSLMNPSTGRPQTRIQTRDSSHIFHSQAERSEAKARSTRASGHIQLAIACSPHTYIDGAINHARRKTIAAFPLNDQTAQTRRVVSRSHDRKPKPSVHTHTQSHISGEERDKSCPRASCS